jgi:hypothetical protein
LLLDDARVRNCSGRAEMVRAASYKSWESIGRLQLKGRVSAYGGIFGLEALGDPQNGFAPMPYNWNFVFILSVFVFQCHSWPLAL